MRRSRHRKNPALRVRVQRRLYSFQELLKKNMKSALRGSKGRKRGIRAMRKALRKTKRQFKRGTVYHAGVKLRIIGWSGRIGAGSRRRRRSRR